MRSPIPKVSPASGLAYIVNRGVGLTDGVGLADGMTALPSLSRRRSLQYHYAASECKQIKCPKGAEADTRTKTDTQTGTQTGEDLQSDSKPSYFDCDPSCVEPQYFYFKKGELVVAGRDYGSEYI